MIDREHPIIPKNPDEGLWVIILGRLSKAKETEEKTEATLESSREAAQKYLESVYEGKFEIRFLGEQISGMVVDRAEILEARELIATGQWDLVLVEEMRCVYRNPRDIIAFVQEMVDRQQRFISVADGIDTATEDWFMFTLFAATRHGMAVPDACRRVRRAATHAFHKGGMVLKICFGHRRLTAEEAKSGQFGPVGLRVAKIPEATPIWHEIRKQLIETRSPANTIDWLIEQKIATGPYVIERTWSLPNLKQAACHPMLHGTRVFRRKLFRASIDRENSDASSTLSQRGNTFPNWRHDARGAAGDVGGGGLGDRLGRSTVKRPSRRRGIPRYKSFWPGYAVICGGCGKLMIIDGDHLRCPRSKKSGGYSCWCRVQVKLDPMRREVAHWLACRLREFPEAREAFVEAAWAIMQEHPASDSRSASCTIRRFLAWRGFATISTGPSLWAETCPHWWPSLEMHGRAAREGARRRAARG